MKPTIHKLSSALCALFLLCGAAAAQAPAKLRFVVLGHLRGDRNGELLSYLPEVVESVRRENPDLVFLCGDLIWGDVDRPGPADRAQTIADWERLDTALLGLGAPVYRVPGNHDVCDLVTRDVFFERYGVLPREITVGSTHFLLLNSAWRPDDGDTRKHPQEAIRGVQLGASQIAFVQEHLSHTSAGDNVFVIMHHLLWWDEQASWWKKVAPEFRGHPLRAVFGGDYGPLKFSHLEREGVHYLQTSLENSVSNEMLRGREASRMLSAQLDNYLVVDVDGSDVRYSVRAVGALSTGKFSPKHYREIYEYDKDTYGRKLLRRWSTPSRLVVGLLEVSGLAFLAGIFSVLVVLLLRRLLRRKAA